MEEEKEVKAMEMTTKLQNFRYYCRRKAIWFNLETNASIMHVIHIIVVSPFLSQNMWLEHLISMSILWNVDAVARLRLLVSSSSSFVG